MAAKRQYSKGGNYRRGGYSPKAPIVKQPRKVASWSNFQEAVFSNVENSVNSLVVAAVPGSGKTTTIVEAVFRLIDQEIDPATILFLAFNTSIAKELNERLPVGVSAKTCHSHGYAAVRAAFPRVSVDSNGFIANNLAGSLVGMESESFPMREALCKAMSLIKCEIPRIPTPDECLAVMDRHGIDMEREKAETFIFNVIKMITLTAKGPLQAEGKPAVSFDDMIWLPLVLDLPLERFSTIFVDEAQDLSLTRTEMIERSLKSGGRIIAVGDPYQAIYGFAGAAPDALPNLTVKIGADILPLSVSYRCARAIVREAAEVNASIEAAPNAPEGEVIAIKEAQLLEMAAPGDAILSPVNAPLLGMALDLVKLGKKATVKGKEVGKRLIHTIKRQKAESVEGLISSICAWRDMECSRLLEMGKKGSAEIIADIAECILVLSQDAIEISDVIERCQNMFSDGDEKNIITLSTVHKFKGLERERVFVLTDRFKRRETQEWENLWYVAVSRAKETLCYVSKK